MSKLQTLILLTLLWPILHNVVYFARFSKLQFKESLVFLPLGFLSALILIFLQSRAKSARQKFLVSFGFLIGLPIGYVGSTLGGLFINHVVGATIYGLAPLLVTMGIGLYLGGLGFKKQDNNN